MPFAEKEASKWPLQRRTDCFTVMGGEKSCHGSGIRRETSKRKKISRSFSPRIIIAGRIEAVLRGLTFRLMFQDEARFGRISEGTKCWALQGIRPLVGAQIVREYTYAYAALSPIDGVMDSFILPDMYTDTLSIFLAKVAQRHTQEFVVMVLDGAPCHRSGTLVVPPNLRLVEQPPYSPELNPTEHLWEEMREKWFANKTFKTMSSVIKTLVISLRSLEKSPRTIQSLSGFHWILNSLPPNTNL